MDAKKIMGRKEFLMLIGAGTAGIALMCSGCSKSAGSNPLNAPSNVDLTLDLNAAANAALLTNGGYMATGGLIVARTTAGAYIAVQQSCTHESYPLNYQASSRQFYCNNHGATFTEQGVVTGGPASRSLVVYKTLLTGTSLRVYS